MFLHSLNKNYHSTIILVTRRSVTRERGSCLDGVKCDVTHARAWRHLARRVARDVMVTSDRSAPKSCAWQILNFENRTIISRDTAVFVKPCQTEKKTTFGLLNLHDLRSGGSTKRIKHLRRGRSIVLKFEKCLCVCLSANSSAVYQCAVYDDHHTIRWRISWTHYSQDGNPIGKALVKLNSKEIDGVPVTCTPVSSRTVDPPLSDYSMPISWC